METVTQNHVYWEKAIICSEGMLLQLYVASEAIVCPCKEFEAMEEEEVDYLAAWLEAWEEAKEVELTLWALGPEICIVVFTTLLLLVLAGDDTGFSFDCVCNTFTR